MSLPDDLIQAEIIPRLDVKSIGLFRCVSKSWQSLFSSPEFVKYHLKLHINDPKHILMLTDNGCRVYSPDSRVEASSNVVVPLSYTASADTSCHGLVLLEGSLMNPITKESLELPDITAGFRYGLGYDGVSDDYKIVSISRGGGAVVYSVKMKTWRWLSGEKLDHGLDYSKHGVFVDGYIYWQWNDGLVAFDLAREEFEKIPPPNADTFLTKKCTTVSVLSIGSLVSPNLREY